MDSLSDACWNLYRRSFCQLRAAFVWEASPHRTDEVFNSTLFAAVLWQKKDKSVVIKFWNDVWCFFPDVWTCLKTCFGKCLKPLSELEPSLIRIQNMDQGLSFHRNRGGVCFSFCKWWTFGVFTGMLHVGFVMSRDQLQLTTGQLFVLRFILLCGESFLHDFWAQGLLSLSTDWRVGLSTVHGLERAPHIRQKPGKFHARKGQLASAHKRLITQLKVLSGKPRVSWNHVNPWYESLECCVCARVFMHVVYTMQYINIYMKCWMVTESFHTCA